MLKFCIMAAKQSGATDRKAKGLRGKRRSASAPRTSERTQAPPNELMRLRSVQAQARAASAQSARARLYERAQRASSSGGAAAKLPRARRSCGEFLKNKTKEF